jgi:hypothetical protein
MTENFLSCVSKASDTWLSPDQTIRLEFLVSEWAPSLWTHTPRVTEVATGEVFLDLWGTSWDAQTAWVGANGLRLDLRRYDRPGTITLLLDIGGGSYRIGEGGGTARPLADVRRGMNEAFEAVHQRYLESLTTPADTDADRAEQDKPSKDSDNRVALVRALLRALMFGR